MVLIIQELQKKLITTVQKIHNSTTPNERPFVSKLSIWFNWYLTKDGDGYYALNSLLYQRMLREKYDKMYEELINQLCMYAKAIVTNCALYDNNSICMVNIIIYSECLYDYTRLPKFSNVSGFIQCKHHLVLSFDWLILTVLCRMH